MIPTLPKSFAICASDTTNPLWEKYITWLNEEYGKDYKGDMMGTYYGVDGGIKGYNSATTHNIHELITLEYWDKCISQEQELPEKWYIPIDGLNDNDLKYLENWVYERCGEKYRDGFHLCRIVLSEHEMDDSYMYYDSVGCMKDEECYDDYKQITVEQLKNKYSIMKTQTITREQLKQIYDVACSSWQTKINEIGKQNPYSTNIEFTDEFVKGMFKAANESQKEVLVAVGLVVVSNSVDCTTHNLETRIVNKRVSIRTKSGNELLATRKNSSEYAGISFYLNNNYNWELKEDNCGTLCLIPTLKY